MELVMFEPWVKNVLEGIEYKIPELRDLFAMNTLNGILASPNYAGTPEQVSDWAYQFADAMLKARKVK